jgi:hypothetical protein
MGVFVGVDWGNGAHAVCVIDSKGAVLERFQIGHDRDGLQTLIARLNKHGSPGDIPIAIERPTGLLVDALVEAGFRVTPIHPNVVKACRPRYRAVAALLHSFWPGAATIFADLASPIALAFLERYPTPDAASRLGPKRLAGFLAQHRYCGRRSPELLLQRLHAAPEGRAGEIECDAKGELVRAMARTLHAITAEIAKLTSRIEHTIAELPDGKIVMSFPRAGQICAAQILAELGDVRERFPTEQQLAAEAGVAPVTYQSGKSRSVGWRWACNKRLRAAITCFADNSRHQSPWAAQIYKRARARGCDHPHATRILARAWARVIWRAWTDRLPYDPRKHAAAKPFLFPAAAEG